MTQIIPSTQRERVIQSLLVPAREGLPHRVERCANTGLTKPECHCRECVAELVRTHAR